MQPLTRDGKFRILALDGGGVKGAYAASVLAGLEQATGRLCRNHFDLICGTSTGGIIALALGLGLAADQVCSFYAEKGAEIFPITGVLGAAQQGVRQLLRPKHDPARLAAALDSVFGRRTLGESSCRLIIPAYDVTESRIYLFKTPHGPSLTMDQDVLARDVALATAAAPTFFSAATVRRVEIGGHRLGGARYIDGGVWANSPAMIGLIEAVHFLRRPPEEVDILSIGTTSQPLAVSPRRSAGGLLTWGARLAELLITSQVQAVEAQASLLTNGGWHRINHVTARGRFGLDRVESTHELIELGRSDAVKRAHFTAVQARFLNGSPVGQYRK